MSALLAVPVDAISTATNRQRREFDETQLQELADSIADTGLIHPVVVRQNDKGGWTLVAGERRLRAMRIVWAFGKVVRCGETRFHEGDAPCLDFGKLDAIDAFEMELEENIRRADLTWQERAQATTDLYNLRMQQARRDMVPEPTVASIAQEVRGSSAGAQHDDTRQELIVSKHMADPDVQKAKTLGDAMKVLKRKEELRRSEALGRSVGLTFSVRDHALFKADCLEWLTADTTQYDVILGDPPYGIGADEYGDSGGKARVEGHSYVDSYENWVPLVQKFAPMSFARARPQAHAYLFCDVDRFHELKLNMELAGWKVFRTPLIWANPTAIRLPWVTTGPQRKWQAILYAVKGDRPVLKMAGDVLTYPSDPNLNHPAQKPVALYADLLSRSCRPGDSVIDPFAGSGTIFPAAHGLKVKATGIERDPEIYGIAVARLGALK